MRFQFDFKMKKNYLPKESHRFTLSVIKYVLSHKDEELFNELYNTKEAIMKPFVSSHFFPIECYEWDKIKLKEARMSLYFSSPNMEICIRFYNAFQGMLNKEFQIKEQFLTLTQIKMLNEKTINESSILIKMLSPLLVRNNINEDLYYVANDSNFNSKFEEITYNQIKVLKPELEYYLQEYPLKIKPVNTKKIVVKHYEQYIDGNLGYFILSSHPSILQFLYQSGIGSRRSMGFGLFNVVRR